MLKVEAKLLLPKTKILSLPTRTNSESLFCTTWFLESILSATFVAPSLSTCLPFFKSLPSTPMLGVTFTVTLITILLAKSYLIIALHFL
jgi:hypothetical protein